MDIVLPKEIQYSPSLPSLPECISQEIVLSPINGGTFGPSQLIQFDLTARGFIDPTSLYIRYRYTLANSGTQTSIIRGTPVYTFFSKLETIIGSTTYENISNYNQICNMMCNCQMDVAMKYGLQSAYGWGPGGTGTPSLEQLDGRVCVANEDGSFSAPLPCIISNAEKMLCAGLMPQIRIQLTTESIANAFIPASGTTNYLPTNYTLSNIELCYTMIDFSGGVNDIVKSMGDKFYIKSQSFTNAGQLYSSGGASTTELVYNLRLASIKSLFANFSGSDPTKCVNGIFDSVDPTSSSGDLQYNIAGSYFPARPVNLKYNKASVLMELKKAFGALHSDVYNFSINQKEFIANDGTTTSYDAPGKFFFAVNTEKISTSNALMTGVSTQNSPITLRINNGGSTAQNYNVYVTAMYDCLLEIDPINRQCVVKQ